MADRLIEAAGGVLWRSTPGTSVEVALVHRPKYDDWSLPKGKLAAGEHVVLGALREVWEETGHHAVPGRPLGEIRYLKDGTPKRVRYWAMRAAGGAFTPNAEVDQVMWMPPREGQQHLLAERDRHILAEFARDTAPTWPCLLIRHGSAGEREAWPGDDRERPLDDLGHAQAQALTTVLDAFATRHVVSADVLRCLDTVGPYAALRQVPVESEPLMSESGVTGHPEAAVARFVHLCAEGQSLAVCSQGKAIPELVQGLCQEVGTREPRDRQLRKGGIWAFHLARRPDGGVRMAGLDRFDAAPPSLTTATA